MNDTPLFDAELLRRHDRPGPRYTSYPTAPQFAPGFGETQLKRCAAATNLPSARRPLSFYVHVPFCLSPCFYCGCNRLISRDPERINRYAQRLLREIGLVAPLFDPERQLVQLHFGGGTPNLLPAGMLETLLQQLSQAFRLSDSPDRDFSIELDPRSVPDGYIADLARLGFNRASFGVQDFDADVQQAVNRIQSVEETIRLIEACRTAGFRSVNVDLIYGLPKQTPEGFRKTLEAVIAVRPDRLAVYAYAHLPQLFKAQRQIDATTLPGPDARLELLRLAIDELTAVGYRYIGMDHFALPEDELVRAREAGELQRNFMGYTTHANTDLVGVGMSAISHVGSSFSQNFRDLRSWASAIDDGRIPVARGLILDADDELRAAVIGTLMCHGRIDIPAIEKQFGIDFADYFGDSLGKLAPHAADGLVDIGRDSVSVTPGGQLLLRSIAMCFDAYLDRRNPAAGSGPLSKVV